MSEFKTIQEFEKLLPLHNASLEIEHNPHKTMYESVESYVKDYGINFERDEDELEAVDKDELWVCRWYPHTPVGFYRVAAPTLARLIEITIQCVK